ncbi:MAG: CRTAC1 family protein [Acidobacteria bacterium]|nr:CRTAC1 family protein [Acidobacteriota bacterium]
MTNHWVRRPPGRHQAQRRKAASARLALTLVFLTACVPPTSTDPASTTQHPIFIDAAPASNLDFVYFNGMSGEHYFNEIMGGGAALFDFDNDGDPDLYLAQGGMPSPDLSPDDALFPPPPGTPLTDRLYRNDLEPGATGASLRFTDVTDASRIEAAGYGMGVATGDFDNDGWTDLYVTNFGSNQFLRNRGDGTFDDVTAASGADDPRWSVAATFFDFDRDGWLDLYVGNYVDYSLEGHSPCPLPSGVMTYCAPGAYRPAADSLFRNRRDGTFEDVSTPSGIGTEPGSGLGAVAADFNGDRWIDLYVANDLMWNRLWINRGDGTFADNALLAGVAVNSEGQPEAGMGVDAGDFNGDGQPDIVLSHLEQETNTLYVNGGAGLFRDQSASSQLGPPSLPFTAFGIGWIDYDNDSWLDLLVVNGAVIGIDAQIREGDPYPLRQTDQLFRNLGDGSFAEVTAEAGAVFESSEVSRAAAFGDVDNDGDLDVVVVNSNAPTRLLLNQVGQNRPWLGLRLVAHNRDALGAQVLIHRQGATPIWRHVHTDGSYASARDPRLLIGLGEANAVSHVEVRWPDGTAERWADLQVGEYQTLVQGEGDALGLGSP